MSDYIIFNLYGDTWGELVEESKYVFLNKDCKIGTHNNLAFLVFHYVANYNLSDLELFFRLAGFSAFTREEMPDSVTNPDVINLASRDSKYARFDFVLEKYPTKEKADKYIESEFGEGIISEYRELKKQLFCHEKNQLLGQGVDGELEIRSTLKP